MSVDVLSIILLLPGLVIVLISMASILIWRSASRVEVRWFGVGAALWVAAVLLKLGCGLLINASVIGCLRYGLRPPYFIPAAGAFIGVESCAFEIGGTWIAARLCPRLGRDAGRAIAVGVGAGAFEALVLSLLLLLGALALLVGVEDAGEARQVIQTSAAVTPLVWLVWPVERLIALLCHASTRALVLLGVAKGRPSMVLCGLLLFAWTDGLAGSFLVAGSHRSQSIWWLELAVLPGALVSIAILHWCYRRWPGRVEAEVAQPPWFTRPGEA